LEKININFLTLAIWPEGSLFSDEGIDISSPSVDKLSFPLPAL
jgi:hypothetical protein